MKVQIDVQTRDDGYGGDTGDAFVEVSVDGEKVADGRIGGEPEDNSRFRDYSWVVPALEALAKKLGAEVRVVVRPEG